MMNRMFLPGAATSAPSRLMLVMVMKETGGEWAIGVVASAVAAAAAERKWGTSGPPRRVWHVAGSITAAARA